MNLLPESESDALQQHAIEIIRPLIPADAQDRVARAVRQYNPVVREQIRSEMGLRLSDDKSRGSVPIQVVDGFPAGVASLIDKYQDVVLWRLVMLQPKLGGVLEGLTGLLEHWEDFERWLQLP